MSRISLPEDLDAERSLLATLAGPGALSPGAGFAEAHQALAEIEAHHLVHPAYREVLKAMKAIYREALEVNALSLKDALDRAGRLNLVGGMPGLVELLMAEDVERPMQLVRLLVDHWRSRQVVHAAGKVLRMVEAREPVDQVITTLGQDLHALSLDGARSAIFDGMAILDRIQQGQPFRQSSTDEKLAWFGIAEIDEAVEGAEGQMVIVAARPGCGKTALMVQGQMETAQRGIPSLAVSLEMDETSLQARMASRISLDSARLYRQGKWTPSGVQMLFEAQKVLELCKGWCGPGGTPWSRVEAVIRDAVREHQVRVVFVDYFTRIQMPEVRKGSTDAAAWSSLSAAISALAQQLGICIVLLCQLNREGDGVEPKLADLKETGGLEQDAWSVLMLWPLNPKAMDGMQESIDIGIKVAKNRSGPAGWKRTLCFEGAINRFSLAYRETSGGTRL